ncbi:hypothetical protein GCM10029992_36680 [Glycomyces albus]
MAQLGDGPDERVLQRLDRDPTGRVESVAVENGSERAGDGGEGLADGAAVEALPAGEEDRAGRDRGEGAEVVGHGQRPGGDLGLLGGGVIHDLGSFQRVPCVRAWKRTVPDGTALT